MTALSDRLGWTLLNSCWQGALAWALLRIALVMMRHGSARARHAAGCAALVIATALPWWTYCALDLHSRLDAPGATVGQSTASAPEVAETPGVLASTASRSDSPSRLAALQACVRPALPWIVTAWGLGAILCLVRLGVRWRAVRGLQTAPRQPWPSELRPALQRACRGLGLDRLVAIGVSTLVEVPTVVGWLQPVILIPPAVVSGLSPLQIEALLAHELAHIARRDFAVNLLQAVAEAVFFFNPAIYAINRHIRREREQACDDLAVEVTGDRLAFAHALAALEAGRPGALACAASGDEPGALLERIRRLLGLENRPTASWRGLAGLAILAAALYVAGMFTVPRVTVWLLTPEQRIAKIKADVPPSLDEIQRTLGPDAVMLVEGEIRRADGTAYLGDTEVRAQIDRKGHRDYRTIQATHGRFSTYLPAGALTLDAAISGYAPVIAGPFYPKLPTAAVAPVTLHLPVPTSATIRFVDPDGKPIPGVALSGYYTSANEANNTIGNRLDTRTSGPAGDVTIDPPPRNVVLHAIAARAGFQPQARDFRNLAPDDPVIWTLAKAIVFHGRVVDAETKAPIFGAVISLAPLADAPPLPPGGIHATTDADGSFVLPNLNANAGYTLRVHSRNYATADITISVNVPAVIELYRGFDLSGRVVGRDLTPGEKCVLTYSRLFANAWRFFPEPIEGMVDPATRTVAFHHLPPGVARLQIGGRSFPVTINGDVRDQVFDFAQADRNTAARVPRKVVVQFAGEPGETAPAGSLDVWQVREYFPGGRMIRSMGLAQTIPVAHSRAEFVVDAPVDLQLRSDRLIGYWFAPEVVTVPGGAETFRITVDVHPAGGLKGVFVDAEGNPVERARIDILMLSDEFETQMRRRLLIRSNLDGIDRSDGHFTATGLPYGSRVVAIASAIDGYNVTLSDPVLIAAASPIPEIRLIQARGTTIRGSVVDENGQPLSNLRLSFTYSTGNGAAISLRPITTDAGGDFELANVNRNVPGTYELTVVDPRLRPSHPVAQARAIYALTAQTKLPLRIVVNTRNTPLAAAGNP